MIMNLRRFYCHLLQTVQLPYFQLFPFFQIPGLKPALKKEKKNLVIFYFLTALPVAFMNCHLILLKIYYCKESVMM